jgi:hypothetical protein
MRTLKETKGGCVLTLEVLEVRNGICLNLTMKISARNQLRGIVEIVDLGVVTAKVAVELATI